MRYGVLVKDYDNSDLFILSKKVFNVIAEKLEKENLQVNIILEDMDINIRHNESGRYDLMFSVNV